MVLSSGAGILARESIVCTSNLASHVSDVRGNFRYTEEVDPSNTYSSQQATADGTNCVNPSHINKQQHQGNSQQFSVPRTSEPKVTLNDVNSTTRSLNESIVPTGRISRAYNFTKLGSSLLANKNDSTASGTILASTLCRMRGGALKLGQMLSIQEESLLPREWIDALQKVRTGADAMPNEQVDEVLNKNYALDGKQTWQEYMKSVPNNKGIKEFEVRPIAAASIGQVHRALLYDDTLVAVKIQFPGVASGIESDLKNLEMLIRWFGMVPKGVFIKEIIDAGREELTNECNYHHEAESQIRFGKLIENDKELTKRNFAVPKVIEDLTRTEVLVTEWANGNTIDEALRLPQETRNMLAKAILRLTMKELFVWRFMQTDPNWGNFLHDGPSGKTNLIDFGSARDYDKEFVKGYLQIVWASANGMDKEVMDQSIKMKFLTGNEKQVMLDAHLKASQILGEPFSPGRGEYEFKGSRITERIKEQGVVFTKERILPPPKEVYTLHRKLAGAFLLCIKLEATLDCRAILEEVMRENEEEDERDSRGN